MCPLPTVHSVYHRVGALRLHAAHARPDASTALPGALPMVLVHGYVISSRYMRPTLRRVARAVACWAPDLPGHGRSDTPAEVPDVPGYADALVAWMDAAGLARAVLVGNSLGAQVVAHAAARHPERVAGIVLVAPTVDARARTAAAQAWALARDAFGERFSLWLLEIADMLRVGPRRMVAMARVTLADRIEATVAAVRERRVPVLVVRGEHDTLVPEDWAAHVAAVAGAPPVVTVPGAAHGVNYDEPEALAAILLAFARELAGTDPGRTPTA